MTERSKFPFRTSLFSAVGCSLVPLCGAYGLLLVDIDHRMASIVGEREQASCNSQMLTWNDWFSLCIYIDRRSVATFARAAKVQCGSLAVVYNPSDWPLGNIVNVHAYLLSYKSRIIDEYTNFVSIQAICSL